MPFGAFQPLHCTPEPSHLTDFVTFHPPSDGRASGRPRHPGLLAEVFFCDSASGKRLSGLSFEIGVRIEAREVL